MKKITRMAAILLAVVTVISMLSIVAFAATSKSGTNIAVTVETGSKPWYSLLRPTVTVKNTGRGSMNVYVANSNGSIISHLEGLKAGKSYTFSLSPNSRYTVYWSGNALAGNWYGTGTVSAGRYISNIW